MRVVVVPTATMRRPCAWARLMASAVGCAERVGLGVEADVARVFDAHGLEGAEADVQRDARDLDAALFELGEDFRGEVQAGGGRGGGASFTGVDSLVALAVFRRVGLGLVAVDVGRQRQVADALERCVEVERGGEAKGALAELACCKNFGGERLGASVALAWKSSVSPGWTFLAGRTSARQSLWPSGVARRFGQQDFDVASGCGRAGLRGEARRAWRTGAPAARASRSARADRRAAAATAAR